MIGLAKDSLMKTTTKFVFLVLILVAFAALPPACLAAGTDSFTVPSSVASQGVFSCGDMTMSGGGTIDSAGIASSGPTNHGTVRSNGKISISSSTVNGDAIPGPGKPEEMEILPFDRTVPWLVGPLE